MTAAMIFPVMMKGGLAANGSGVAQVLKVRLIHATIRNLILHDSPQHAVEALGDRRDDAGAGVVAAHAALAGSPAMTETMFGHGWKLGEDGLPCNQEELAYTLLTFGYVFLRSLRRLGIGLAPADEEAFLHCWNVAGHVLGIAEGLMPQTMDEAAALFRADAGARPGRTRRVRPAPAPRRRPGPDDGRRDPVRGVQAVPRPDAALPVRRRDREGPRHRRAGAGGRRARLRDPDLRDPGDRYADALPTPISSISRFFTRIVGYRFMTKFPWT